MPKIQFVGRVVPASLPPLTLPPWDTDFDDGTNKMLYKIRIIHSAVNAECETNLPITSTTWIYSSYKLLSICESLSEPLYVCRCRTTSCSDRSHYRRERKYFSCYSHS